MTVIVEAEAEVSFMRAAATPTFVFFFFARKSIFKQTEATARQRILQIDAQPYR